MNTRYYWDYNSTSPLSNSVKEYLKRGDFFYANPASIHTSGKNARRSIEKTKDYLLKTFCLSEHKVLFHSGVTEAVNTFFKGLYPDEKYHFFYFESDHPCVLEVAKWLENKGHETTVFSLQEDGSFDLEEIISVMNKSNKPKVLNFTWVHNETGVVWDLCLAREIKKQTNCLIHVDGAQVVGKIADWSKLDDSLDIYTFSGHKFGALKAIGWSFIASDVHFSPLILGGDQQQGLRSGTENPMGVETLKLALMDIENNYQFDEQNKAKMMIEDHLIKLLCDKGEIIGKSARRNGNTINFIHYTERADILLAAFDITGADVSSGSACSSQSLKPSQTLVSMGYGEWATNGIRLSFSPYLTTSDIEVINKTLTQALKNFCQ